MIEIWFGINIGILNTNIEILFAFEIQIFYINGAYCWDENNLKHGI
jgi:hypothetical protein